MLTSLASLNHESYVPRPWHTSLIMICLTILVIFTNLWFKKVLNFMEGVAGILHISLFVVFIAMFICLGKRNDNEFVFKTLVHDQSGWTNPGVAWGIGILTMTFSMSGLDSVIHMSEFPSKHNSLKANPGRLPNTQQGDEVKKVHTRVPRSIIVAAASNGVMLITFALVFLLYGGRFDTLGSSLSLPIVDVVYHTTGSKAATNALMSLLMLVYFTAMFNVFASVSRLVWAFSRDGGLPFSSFFAHVRTTRTIKDTRSLPPKLTTQQVHPTLRVPTRTFLITGTTTTLLSLIYIGSSAAYNALISLCALGITLSYMAPITFLLLRKLRGPPPPFGPFSLGRYGIPCNVFTLCYLVFISIWIPFPANLPVTGSNMNYAGPIFGAAVLLALGDCALGGQRRFRMPVKRYE